MHDIPCHVQAQWAQKKIRPLLLGQSSERAIERGPLVTTPTHPAVREREQLLKAEERQGVSSFHGQGIQCSLAASNIVSTKTSELH